MERDCERLLTNVSWSVALFAADESTEMDVMSARSASLMEACLDAADAALSVLIDAGCRQPNQCSVLSVCIDDHLVAAIIKPNAMAATALPFAETQQLLVDQIFDLAHPERDS